MKIQSRPDTEIPGTGDYVLRMELEELQLIAALMYVTRLGRGSRYKKAAFNLLTTVEDLFGCDFSEEASTAVDLSISIVEDDGVTVKEEIHYHNICIEV